MKGQVASLVARNFPGTSQELCIGGVGVSAIAEEFGTPLFIYSRDVLDRQCKILRECFPDRFSLYYSVKANPNPVILRHFLSKNLGLEIASGGEFHLAVSAGCPAAKIVFAGPGKTDQELRFVLSHHIDEIHAESLQEVERLSVLSRELGVRGRVALRVNPCGEAQGGAMRMGGKSAPFGIDEEYLDPVVDRVVRDSSLEFRGIHLFTGTQILDDGILTTQYRRGVALAGRLAARLGRAFHTIDFGGGLGIPYFAHEQALDMEKLHCSLESLVNEIQGDALLRDARLMVEPGRFLVGEAGIYVTRVVDIKMSRGKKYLVLDGGMNHHLAASGNLGQVIRRNFPAALLTKLRSDTTDVVELVGPLCTPLDILGRDVPFPPACIGDLVGIFQSGAYALSASPVGFLSHPTPAEVMVYDDSAHAIRLRGAYSDLSRDVPA